MYQLTIFKLLCVATITSATQLEPKIVKGYYAIRGLYPSVVAIRNIHNAHICTGVIVDQLWALTTAHCIYEKGGSQPNDILLVSNTLTTNASEGKYHSVSHLIYHPNFDPNTYSHDLLLIRVEEKFYPALLEKDLINEFSPVYVGKLLIAAGWGRESENSTEFSTRLKFTYLRTVDSKNEICENNAYTFCAEAVDGGGTCLGDCGGPVFDKSGKTLVGVITHKGKGCTPGEVEQIIRIEPYKKWIWETTGNHFAAFIYGIKNFFGK